jgi:hypothetical protein
MVRVQVVLGLVLAGAAAAGTPVDVQMTCPVGGETFTVTETASCSTYGRSMALRQMSSCDFVTRLPVCPGNGLPLYRTFEGDDIARLDAVVTGPDWPGLRSLSDWQRAYALADRLGERGEAGFGLQLGALWYESDRFLADPVAMSLFDLAADAAIEGADPGSVPYLKALKAYVRVASGRRDEATSMLAELRRLATGNADMSRYLDRLAACNVDWVPDSCGPGAPFD